MIEAKVTITNDASKALLMKLGFRQDAILRQRRIDYYTQQREDLVVYSITRTEMRQNFMKAEKNVDCSVH